MRIVIVDDHRFILESIEILLSSISRFEIVGICNHANEVIKILEKDATIDLVMTDLNMPETTGIDLTYLIRERFPKIKVLLLTVEEDPSTIKEAFAAGVSGYLMKKAGKAEFELALDTLASGKKYYSESVVNELLNNKELKKEGIVYASIEKKTESLSNREIEIVKLIVAEYSTSQIAEKLFLSPATIETHRHNILRKLGLKNSIGLVKFAIKNGLLH